MRKVRFSERKAKEKSIFSLSLSRASVPSTKSKVRFSERKAKEKSIFSLSLSRALVPSAESKVLMLSSLLLLLLASCLGGSPDGKKSSQAPVDTIPMMVMQIQKCARLYTAEYKVHKIITHSDQLKLKGSFLQQAFDIHLPVGDRKVAIPMDATLKAYVDFGEFSANSIRRQGDRIEIILPDPKVVMTSSRIDHEHVRRHVSFLRSNFTDAELTNYERQGRASILNSVPQMGITEMAKANAARTLVPMIVKMGFEEPNITISFRKDFSPRNLQQLLDQSIFENEKKKLQ